MVGPWEGLSSEMGRLRVQKITPSTKQAVYSRRNLMCQRDIAHRIISFPPLHPLSPTLFLQNDNSMAPEQKNSQHTYRGFDLVLHVATLAARCEPLQSKKKAIPVS